MMKSSRRGLVAFLLLAAGGDVPANEVREYGLEKKARLSDVVVIGHVVSKSQEGEGGLRLELSRVQVDKVLKGTLSDGIEVLSKGSISELNPDCCEVGKAYLFFLVKRKDGRFGSVNGRFGIYVLPEVSGPPGDARTPTP
jgi:hypothetical protein